MSPVVQTKGPGVPEPKGTVAQGQPATQPALSSYCLFVPGLGWRLAGYGEEPDSDSFGRWWEWVTGHWADILKDMNRGLPGPAGGGTCFPRLTQEETGAQGEEAACSRGEARGEGLGPEPLCPLAGSPLPLVCKSAGRAKEASWCCGDLWKMKRREGRKRETFPEGGCRAARGQWPQGPARVC